MEINQDENKGLLGKRSKPDNPENSAELNQDEYGSEDQDDDNELSDAENAAQKLKNRGIGNTRQRRQKTIQ